MNWSRIVGILLALVLLSFLIYLIIQYIVPSGVGATGPADSLLSKYT